MTSALPTRELRYLALGDSYTIGEGVPTDARWPVRLAAMLRYRGLPMATPEIVARTGWTCDELAAGIDAANPRGPFALVSLLIGVNDQFRGATATQYAPSIAHLLACAREFAGGTAHRVVVLSIPDWGVSPFAAGRDRAAIAQAIDTFNAVNCEAARAIGAGYVDITSASRMATNASQFVTDGLHPHAAAYEAWATLALPVALSAIAR